MRVLAGSGETCKYFKRQGAVHLAPKGRDNEAQANGLGQERRTVPIAPPRKGAPKPAPTTCGDGRRHGSPLEGSGLMGFLLTQAFGPPM